jgi:hypothetical protein
MQDGRESSFQFILLPVYWRKIATLRRYSSLPIGGGISIIWFELLKPANRGKAALLHR